MERDELTDAGRYMCKMPDQPERMVLVCKYNNKLSVTLRPNTWPVPITELPKTTTFREAK